VLAVAEPRFNPNHAAAGSATGGQFAPAAGSGSKKAPAKKAPAGKAPAGKETGKAPAGKDGSGSGGAPASTPREKLLAEAKADRERARELEKQLHVLEHQHAQSVAAAKQSAADAAKAKKAKSVIHHRKHTAAHQRHTRHAASLVTRIGHLRTQIHTLRAKAASLEKQAKGKRDESPGVSVAERIRAAVGTAERDVSQLQFGHGSALWKYWTAGKGLAKWSGALHKWRTLRDLLLKAGVPAHSVDGLTTNIIMAVMPGYMKLAHAKSGGGMKSTTPDGEFRTIPLSAPLDITASGDGLTFEGYAAVYNQTARISARDGDFDEQIMPGAFRAIADGNYPRLMFEHGRHPLIGTMPLGKITDAREDDTGLWIEARLTDNWLISPVRDAIAAGALDGMSFRFTVDDGGELWEDRSGDVPLRSLSSLSVPELGPVVFPAYEPTTASVRSVLDTLPVIGRPAAGAAAASDRGGAAPERAEPDPSLTARFRRDAEALALRGIQGVKLR
jgi:HK97 family phage prohead protease